MQRLAALALAAATLTFTSGCTMCKSYFFEDYTASGGTYQREIANSGRVGSAFEPAGAEVIAPADVTPPPAEDTQDGAEPRRMIEISG